MEIGVHHPRRDSVRDPGFGLDAAAPRRYPHPAPVCRAQSFRVIRIDFHQRLAIHGQQSPGTAGHLSAVPVIQHAAGAQDERIVVIR